MKKTIKNVLQFLMAVVFVLVLVGCETSSKITVKFNSNGGSAVADIEVELDKITEFKLPDNPTKDGFDFVGWFTDETLNEKFTALVSEEGTVTLYAKWEEVPVTVDEVKVVYNVNGGTAISEKTVKADDVSSFVPETPTFEGKFFAGWYVDAAFTTEFTALTADNDEVTLYAKWDDPVSFETKFTFKLELGMTAEATEGEEPVAITPIAADVTVVIKAKNINSDNYKDYVGEITLDVDFVSAIEQVSSTAFTIKAYLSDGNVYATIPATLVNPELGEDLKVKIDLADLVEASSEKLAEEVEANEIFDEFIGLSPQEIQEKIMEKISPYILELSQMGFDEKFLSDLGEVFAVLKPAETVSGQTTTHEITNEQVNTFFTSLLTFLEANTDKLYDLNEYLVSLQTSIFDDDDDDYVVDGLTFKAEGWVDEEGTFHPYSEDTDGNHGEIDSLGRYWPYYSYNGYFDTKDNWKYVKGSGTQYRFFPEGASGWIDSDGNFHEMKEDFTELNNGYIVDEEKGIYYCYRTSEYYHLSDGTKFTPEEVREYQIETAKANYASVKEMINYLYTLNACKVELTKDESGDPKKYDFDFNVTLNIAEQVVTINFETTGEMVSSDPVIELPEFDETYLDVTTQIIDEIFGTDAEEVIE